MIRAHRSRLRSGLLAFAVWIAAPDVASAQANGGAFITNGVVQLGVNRDGSLNVPGGSRSTGAGNGTGTATSVVGLRYVPTGAEATANGCLCEGWGVADKVSRIAGGANQAFNGPKGFGLTLETFAADSNTATSVVRVGSTFRVTHRYSPSLSPNLYQLDVTIENISSAATDVLYRRTLDWDIEPTAGSEFVTIVGQDPTTGVYPANLAFSSDNGFASSAVLNHPGSILFIGGPAGVDRIDSGPTDHGAVFDFKFGVLSAGTTKTFRIFYGAAGNETSALGAIAAVGAELYSLGQPNVAGGATLGTPNTFIFAFTGVGGAPVVSATNTQTTVSAIPAAGTTFGEALTLSATVEAEEGTVAPGGTVHFRDGSTVIGTAELTPIAGTLQSTATMTTSVLPAGNRSVTAVYCGGSNSGVNFRVSESSPVVLVIDRVTPSFAGIVNPTIVFGTTSATVAGVLRAELLVPPGTVGVTLNGVEQTAVITSAGVFTATFDTSTLGAGSYVIGFAYEGNANFTAAAGVATLTVQKAPLTITAIDATRVVGSANPTFSVLYSGFVPGEDASVLAGNVTLTTAATPASGAGTYLIVPSGVSSPNYTITFSNGTLTVRYNVRALYDVTKAHKRGSTVPIKLQLCDADGATVSSPTVALTATSLERVSAAASASVEDSGQANPDANFRYDASLVGYIFNLKTTGLATGTYRLTFSVTGDPTPHSTEFQVR